jgi:hypothetical protein
VSHYASRAVQLDDNGAGTISAPPARLSSIMARALNSPADEWGGTASWSCARTGQSGSMGEIAEDAEPLVDGSIAISGTAGSVVLAHIRF